MSPAVLPARLFLAALLAAGTVLPACAPNDTTADRDFGTPGAPDDAAQGGAGGGSGEGGAGGSSVDAPVELAPVPVSCGELMPWTAGTMYKEADRVANGNPARMYECRPWPNSGWCPMAAYEPGKPDAPWMDAWTDLGPCP